jgi:hypothetical protein
MPPVTDHLNEFRRMRDSGELDDQEYSRVVQSISTIEQVERGDDEDETAREGLTRAGPAGEGVLRGIPQPGDSRRVTEELPGS